MEYGIPDLIEAIAVYVAIVNNEIGINAIININC